MHLKSSENFLLNTGHFMTGKPVSTKQRMPPKRKATKRKQEDSADEPNAKKQKLSTQAQALTDVFVGFVAQYLEGYEVATYSRVSKSWYDSIHNVNMDSSLWKNLCTLRFGFNLVKVDLDIFTVIGDQRPWFNCYKNY